MSTNRPQKGVAASRTVATGNVQRASGKAISLQARLLRHPGEWLVLVDDRRVPPPNILAERDLRPPVVLRKIRFSHRSDEGAKRMAALMTISETARRRGHRMSDIYFKLFTRPPDRVLRRLYADA